jgi:hypothetical protein
MVGLPDDLDQFPDVLGSLADPGREVLLVVDDDEFPQASAAADRFRRRVQSRPSAPLLESAASSGSYQETLSGIQVVLASRPMAPAAVQMLLDLAALRRVNPDDIPESIGGRPVYLKTKGNMPGRRAERTLFRSPIRFAELAARYHELSEPSLEVVRGKMSPTRQLLVSLRVPPRPVLLLSPSDAAVVARVPLARHLGAILLFASDDGIRICAQLAPKAVYATPLAAARLPTGPWTLHHIAEDAGEMSASFQTLIAEDHAAFLTSIPTAYPQLLASRELLAEMAPADYLMLVTDSSGERPWAFLAGNYAASLSAPVLLVDGSIPDRDPRLPAAARLLDGRQWRESRGRDLDPENPPPPDLVPLGLDILGSAGSRLVAMAPQYLGFMTSRADFPIELVGDPPLATRYAVGRLAGPDLDSTALLITQAALTEDVARPSRIPAVVADAGLVVPSRPLWGARDEAAAVRATLAGQADVDVEFVQGEGDLFNFLSRVVTAGLVHFAGHGRYDNTEPARSGLVFDSGVLTPTSLLEPLAGKPIIFSNACESGLIDNHLDGSLGDRADTSWTGLAATFLLRGAANYLGSLWPIYDDSSREIAETFYELLCRGTPVGEALRRARECVHAEKDPTWAAFVLFGCPRNRIRPPRSERQLKDED